MTYLPDEKFLELKTKYLDNLGLNDEGFNAIREYCTNAPEPYAEIVDGLLLKLINSQQELEGLRKESKHFSDEIAKKIFKN
jgi:hypothetical protein